MRYCTMELRHGPDGWAPDFPDGVGFLLLAEPGRGCSWGLYEYTAGDEHSDWQPEAPIGPELIALIESARRYPPALALARGEMTALFEGRLPERLAFLSAFREALAQHLAASSKQGYLLAPAIREEIGYLVAGEWYWILAFSSARRDSVRWVSDDFFVYTNPTAHFDLGDGRMERLRVGR